MSVAHIDIDTPDFKVSADIPITPVLAWWRKLVRRNALNRAYEDGLLPWPTAAPECCPACNASPIHLTVVDEDRVRRACRKCRTRFDIR